MSTSKTSPKSATGSGPTEHGCLGAAPHGAQAAPLGGNGWLALVRATRRDETPRRHRRKIMAQMTIQPRATTNGTSAGNGPVWQVLSVEDALRQQGTDSAQGLSAAEAAARLQKYGPNA